jgi:hypothetical protein
MTRQEIERKMDGLVREFAETHDPDRGYVSRRAAQARDFRALSFEVLMFFRWVNGMGKGYDSLMTFVRR